MKADPVEPHAGCRRRQAVHRVVERVHLCLAFCQGVGCLGIETASVDNYHFLFMAEAII